LLVLRDQILDMKSSYGLQQNKMQRLEEIQSLVAREEIEKANREIDGTDETSSKNK
jgi:hypothetical protein